MTQEHIKNRIAYLERFLDERPLAGGDGDWSFMEDAHNELLAEEVEEEIKKLKALLTTPPHKHKRNEGRFPINRKRT